MSLKYSARPLLVLGGKKAANKSTNGTWRSRGSRKVLDHIFFNERAQDYAYFIDREEITAELLKKAKKIHSCARRVARSFAPAKNHAAASSFILAMTVIDEDSCCWKTLASRSFHISQIIRSVRWGDSGIVVIRVHQSKCIT